MTDQKPPATTPASGGSTTPPASNTEATAPPPAAKPAVAQPKGKGGGEMSRRGFLSTLGIAWTTFAAACGAGAVATGRFMFPNVLFEPPQTFLAGFPSDFIVGLVDIRFKESFGVFMVRDDQSIYALKAICTHLGCTPNWLEESNKFKCPCHGSGYDSEGINFEGPAPRPMDRAKLELDAEGQIVVDASQLYQCPPGGTCHFEDEGASLTGV